MAHDFEILIQQIDQNLAKPFTGRDHLLKALTHRSFVNESPDLTLQDNERYEFLGDAVLQLAVSDYLMRHHPEDTEGTLSKLRSVVVNERSLAQVARDMDLGQFILLGKGEELTQGRKKDSILADAFEAVVAAVYLAGGFADASAFVEHYLRRALRDASDRSDRHDFKTTLQELTQRYWKKAPSYRLVVEEGPDHDKMFESEVWIGDERLGGGKAKSKKDSEQIAAKEAIEAIRARMPGIGLAGDS